MLNILSRLCYKFKMKPSAMASLLPFPMRELYFGDTDLLLFVIELLHTTMCTASTIPGAQEFYKEAMRKK